MWKLPGGLSEPGESIKAAAIREVFEETGVKCRFKSVLGFREMKGYNFGMQDLYFICLLEPEEQNSKINVLDKQEVMKADWIDLDTLQSQKAKMAPLIAGLIRNSEQIDWSKVEDKLFAATFAGLEFEMFGAKQTLYTSELLRAKL
jgi:ADP-ribose pyrophosphatase YjhB (NUDIX family)